MTAPVVDGPALPSVSFVITSHNYGRYVGECVRSALDQSLPSQVVVVDDGSTDDSLAVLRAFGDRIVLVEQDCRGQGAAINAGVAVATGDIVLLLDSDDTSQPDRALEVARALADGRQADWLIHNVTVEKAGQGSTPPVYEDLYKLDPEADLMSHLVASGDTFGTNSGLAFRRSVLDRIGPIPDAYVIYPDCFLIAMSILHGAAAILPQSLSHRRIHDGQASGRRRYDRRRMMMLLRIKRDLADKTRAAAARLPDAPPVLSAGATWWQAKADLQWAKVEAGRRRDVFRRWSRLTGAVARDQYLTRPRAVLLLGRETALTLLPRGLFGPAWWATHYGRSGLLTAALRRLAVSAPKG